MKAPNKVDTEHDDK